MREFPKAVSIVMRSFNEDWAIGDTIHGVFNQDAACEIELIVIDSGSADGTIDRLCKDHRVRLIEIPLGSYVPGKVLNLGAREASHDWIVYLNADATPADRQWLGNLITPALEDPQTGAVFSRQIPRPDCMGVFAHDYDRCFGPQRESVHWDHFFSMVSCVTQRSVINRHPIREDLQYAEDDEWTRRMIAAGLHIHYAIDSVVMHSHNYTLKQSYKRAFGDSMAMAATGTTDPRHVNLHYFVALGWLRDVMRDAKWLVANGKTTQIPHAAMVRLAQRLGRRAGYHHGWKHYQRTL